MSLKKSRNDESREVSDDTCCEMYVGNYPSTFGKKELFKIFQEYDIVKVRKLFKKENKVFAFVQFKSRESMKKAVKELSDYDIQGRKLKLYAVEGKKENNKGKFRNNTYDELLIKGSYESLRLDHDGPPPLEHDGPPPLEHDGPPPLEHDGPPPLEHDEPPPLEHDEPPPLEHDEPPPLEHDGPPPLEHDGPPPLEHDGPPPLEHDGPPPLEHDGPPPLEHDGPPPLEHDGPPPLEHDGPPPLEHDRPPPLEYDGPPPLEYVGLLPLERVNWRKQLFHQLINFRQKNSRLSPSKYHCSVYYPEQLQHDYVFPTVINPCLAYRRKPLSNELSSISNNDGYLVKDQFEECTLISIMNFPCGTTQCVSRVSSRKNKTKTNT
ncbi:uncharacterized protein LOC143240328 isoform X3 [Tachypleus tridentatus]|uniref:uncharacterized protein LOC143240328 isoform X3 n=1 Tax=Tachypleus tridentatus TaxID=6853 RepID=UPI003FD06693